jgi:hypothetical protein
MRQDVLHIGGSFGECFSVRGRIGHRFFDVNLRALRSL